MLAAIRSAAVIGIEAYDVTVEVDASKGLPQWTIVGLAAGAVKESRERVASALVNAGFTIPPRRYTINLAPADIRKEGTAFDLPIALGVLVATGQLETPLLGRIVALGELGLDGSLREVRGVLPVAMHVGRTARDAALLIVPPGNAGEARLVSRLLVGTPASIGNVVRALRQSRHDLADLQSTLDSSQRAGQVTPPDERTAAHIGGSGVGGAPPAPATAETLGTGPGRARPPDGESLDLADVVGQETAKRALELAAAGGHAMLMIGPPGGGKTMLARRLPSILPPLTEEETLEVLAVHSVAGLLRSFDLTAVQRPFRAPHHTLSGAALIGGGSWPRPGEVSLAHQGVLFLDELQEMPRSLLDALRQPMEDGRVLISRAQHSVSFPARFALVGAMNPCPCGHAGNSTQPCTCTPADVVRHRARVSGPLADRIDMTIQVPPVAITALARGADGESSATIRQRVLAARERQRERYRALRRVTCNAHAQGRWLDARTPIAVDARSLLTTAAERLRLSARGYHRVLKVARTIADLDGNDTLSRQHVAEALFFRTPDNLPSPERVG